MDQLDNPQPLEEHRKYPIYLPPSSKFDFLSPEFDASLCLATPNTPVPCLAVRARDSIQQCRHYLDPSDVHYKPAPPQTSKQAAPALLGNLEVHSQEHALDNQLRQSSSLLPANDEGKQERKCDLLDGLTTGVAYFPGIQPRGVAPGATSTPGPTALLSGLMNQSITIAIQGPIPPYSESHSQENQQVNASFESWKWGCARIVRGILVGHDAFGSVVLKDVCEVRWVPGNVLRTEEVVEKEEDFSKREGDMSAQEAEQLLFGAKRDFDSSSAPLVSGSSNQAVHQDNQSTGKHWAKSLTGVRARLYKKQLERRKYTENFEQNAEQDDNNNDAGSNIQLDEKIDRRESDRFTTLCDWNADNGEIDESKLKEVLLESLSLAKVSYSDCYSNQDFTNSSVLWFQRTSRSDTLYIPHHVVLLITPSPKINVGSGLNLPWIQETNANT